MDGHSLKITLEWRSDISGLKANKMKGTQVKNEL